MSGKVQSPVGENRKLRGTPYELSKRIKYMVFDGFTLISHGFRWIYGRAKTSINVKHLNRNAKNNHNLIICRCAISTVCSPFLPVVKLFPSQPRNACRRVINRPSQYSLDPSKWNSCDRLETTDYAYPTRACTELYGTSTIPNRCAAPPHQK